MRKMNSTLSIIAAVALSFMTLSPALAAENATAVPAPAAASAAEKDAGKTVAAPTVKIGSVSMMKVSEESAIGKASKEKFKAKAEKAKAQAEAREKQLDKQKKAL